jgi:hypothetical protein
MKGKEWVSTPRKESRFVERPQGGGAGGEGGGFLVFPSGVELGVGEQLEDGEVHVLAVGVSVLHGVWFGMVLVW